MEYFQKPEEVGELLLKVQDDLSALKDQLNPNKPVDLEAIKSAIEKAEFALRGKTDKFLSTVNNQVTVLPSLEEQAANGRTAARVADNMAAGRTAKQGQPATRSVQRSQPRSAPTFTERKPLPGLRKAENFRLTPAERLKLEMAQKAMYNPGNKQNRQTLNSTYGVSLPLSTVNEKKQVTASQKVILGQTIEHLEILPASNRKDPQLAPPPITENDAQHGILSLLERGLIPTGADLHLDPSPVRQTAVPLHEPTDRKDHKTATDTLYNLAVVKLDASVRGASTIKSGVSSKLKSLSPMQSRKIPRHKSIHLPRQSVSQKTIQLQLDPIPPPTTPALDQNKQTQHYFPIQNGAVRDVSSEFILFRAHYCLAWGPVVPVLEQLENLMTEYAIPLAFIKGDRVAEISMDYELDTKIPQSVLLSSVVNIEDVKHLIQRPGQRFRGPGGRDNASTVLQTHWRAHICRRDYHEYRRKKWAAAVIALTWVMNVKMATMKKQLKITRARELVNFKERAKVLAHNWPKIKQSKRVIIHLPSMGRSLKIRSSLQDFAVLQNTQMGRLTDIKDPNVDVIYVSPILINDEALQYYNKMLALKPAVDSGNVEHQLEQTDRYKIIVPEAIKSFPTHRMCLATHLKYSPKALNRIKALIQGREAYIVSGMPHPDDLSVAEFLNVPVLCPEPEVARLYSSKSGSKRVFAAAGAPVPPGVHDVYSLGQLHDSLAQLITDNLRVTTWLLKIDDEFDGRGTAYCCVSDYLGSYKWALKESIRYGDKWSKRWAQEPAYLKILTEIPNVLDEHIELVRPEAYAGWKSFLAAFLARGGVIEAAPPSDSVTALSVDMLIEPDGKIGMVSCGDQIHSESPFRCWGLSMPQSSIEPSHLNAECVKIGKACKDRGVVGYFTVDFVTFIDSATKDQLIWATDISLEYGETHSMFCLTQFLTNGSLNLDSHVYTVAPPKSSTKKRRKHIKEEEPPPPVTTRYAVTSSSLLHTNLSVVHYSVFFQMCRAHGIGYDVKEKQGTVFTLVDSPNREHMGLVVLGESLQTSLASFARTLSCIHQEISAPNMQGITNFKNAIEDIEGILGMTIQNVESGDSSPDEAGR